MRSLVTLAIAVLAGSVISACGSNSVGDLEIPYEREINPIKFRKCLTDRLVIDGGQCRRQAMEYAFEQCMNVYANQCWEESYEYVLKD